MQRSDLVAGMEEAWRSILTLLGSVEGDEWDRPTPCSEWTVRDLAAHLGAIESSFQGLPQPETEMPGPDAGLDGWTAAGVKARTGWSPEEVIAEVKASSDAQLGHLRGLDDAGWEGQRMGPLGPTDEAGLAAIRIFDVYLHLLDLRAGLGRPLDLGGEPTALEVCVDRALEFSPWGAVKKARLADGSRVRLDLSAPGERKADLVVEGGRGALQDPSGDSPDVVSGTGAAYLLVATGRADVAALEGGLEAIGDTAEQFVAGYRIF